MLEIEYGLVAQHPVPIHNRYVRVLKDDRERLGTPGKRGMLFETRLDELVGLQRPLEDEVRVPDVPRSHARCARRDRWP